MKNNRDLALGWLAKAENDLSAAKWMLENGGNILRIFLLASRFWL